MKTNLKQTIPKTTGFIVLGILVILIICIVPVILTAFSGSHISTAIVRKAWEESPLANSAYFNAKEIPEKAKEDRIYLHIDGISPDVIYICQPSSLSKYCWVEVDGVPVDEKQFGLSGYFWRQNRATIEPILEKYTGSLDKWPDRWSDVQINVYNDDANAATAFVRELLEIPDMQKLYSAYKAEIDRSTETDARVAFGEYWLDFYPGPSNATSRTRHSLFGYALENGM